MPAFTYLNKWRGAARRQKRLREVRARTKARMRFYSSLTSIDDETKKVLLPTVLRTQNQLAGVDLWYRRISRAFNLIGTTVGTSLLFGASYLFMRYILRIERLFDFVVKEHPKEALLMYGILLITLILVIIPNMALRLFSKRVRAFLPFSKIISLWLWGTVLLYGVALSQVVLALDRNQNVLLTRHAISTGMVGGLACLTWLIVYSYLFHTVRVIFRRRVFSFYTDAIIINEFLRALSHMENINNRLIGTGFKNNVISHIETAAGCVETYLPQRLRTGNKVTDSWADVASAEIAAGMRELIKWMITPKQDTIEHLKNRLTSYFIFASRGDWDSFPRISVQRIPQQVVWRSRIKIVATALVSSAIPIITLWVVKRLDIVTGPILLYLTVGGYIWSALTLLSHLDPNYGAKLTAIKDITQLLPFSKKEKE